MWVVLGFVACAEAEAELELGFYDKTCPKAETIIADYVKKHIPNAPTVAATLLRTHFHDCFVRVMSLIILNSSS